MSNNDFKILHDFEIKTMIEKSILNSQGEVIIFSAFAKVNIIKWIDENIGINTKKELLVRFRKSDILSGATDFELIDYCQSNDWNLKFDLNLHSKIYIFDKENFLIGSANATNKGLSLVENSNKETMVSGLLNIKEFNKIKSMFMMSSNFTDNMISCMKKEISNITSEGKINLEWSSEIISEILTEEIFLLKEDLLTSDSISNLSEHDKSILDIGDAFPNDYSIEVIKSRFIESKVYRWIKLKLMNEPNGILYFGELSKLLHSEIAINNKIFRVDVKKSLRIILNWIIELGLDEIVIDRPNYSQRIRLNT